MKRKRTPWPLLTATLAAATLCLSVSACGSGAELVTRLEASVTSCESCKDKACADGVWNSFIAFVKTNPGSPGTGKNRTKALGAAADLRTCLVKKGVSLEKMEADVKRIRDAAQ